MEIKSNDYAKMTYIIQTSLNKMTTIENRIHPEHRFAKRDKQEYHVFSTSLEDVSTVEKWVGLTQPKMVLMDPKSYEELRNKRIGWIFDEGNVLVACKITEE